MLIVGVQFTGWLTEVTSDLDVSPEARAYTVSTLDRISRDPQLDMSRESIVLSYAAAGGFPDFQRIGDWVLFKASVLPTEDDGLIVDFGRLAYARCYRLVRSWRVYDELSDDLPRVVRSLRGAVRRAPAP